MFVLAGCILPGIANTPEASELELHLQNMQNESSVDAVVLLLCH